MMRFIVSFTVALVGLLSAIQVSALEIRIRAEAKLEVAVSGAGTVAQVAGALRDDLGRGLPQRDVLVQIDASSGATLVTRRVRTDARGRFGVQEELPPGNYEVFVRFDKTEHLDGIADSKSLRLAPAPVEVRAYGPALVYGRDNPAWLSVRAVAAGIAYQGWAEVFVGDRNVGRAEFDASGRSTFDLAPHLAVGQNAVRVRTPGSAYRDEAEARVDVRFVESVTLEATISERLERLQRGLAVAGTLRDSEGPIPQMRVIGRIEPQILFEEDSAGRSFAVTAVTDDEGRFVAFVPAVDLADGIWQGRAEFVPPLGARVEVDAGTAEVDTRVYRMAVNGFGLTAIVLGLLVLLGRVGQSVLARWRRYRRGQEQAARQAAALEEVETIVPVFLDPGAGTSVELSRDDIGGVVYDVWQERPVPGAQVVLRRGADDASTLQTRADDRGRFRFAGVPAGTWQLEVTEHGFIRGLLELTTPHDGRLSHFRVDLVAVPLKIRRLYGSVMERSVGEDLWGRLSPREIEARLDEIWPAGDDEERTEVRRLVAARLRGQTASEVVALAALTEVVEESYFSGRRYGEDAFLLARAIALELVQRPVPPREGA